MHNIPAHKIATVVVTPLDHNGNPAVIDGTLSFALSPGSEAFAELLESEENNTFELKAMAAGDVTVIVTGDILLGDDTEEFERECHFTIYEQADHLDCEVVDLRDVIDT